MAGPFTIQSKEVLSPGLHVIPAVTLVATPTVDNLIIVAIKGIPFGAPTWANGWTLEASEGTSAFTDQARLIWRYVQGGDTATLPTLENSGITWQNTTVVAWEVSGVDTTFTNAKDQSAHGALSSSSTPSIVTLMTSLDDELALFFGCQDLGSSAAPTMSSGWTRDQSEGGGANQVAYAAGEQSFATSGSSVDLTWTYTEANAGRYVGILLISGAPPADGGRLTQAPVLILGENDVAGRLTQAPLLVVAEFLSEARLTQAPLLVLIEDVPCLTRWSQCWKIVRIDGTVFAFTDHDDVVSFNGVSYSPCHSLTASASELGALIGSVGNVDLNGIISDDAITEIDLLGGKFDGAFIEIWMVPWTNQGGEIPFRLSSGVGGNVEQRLTSYRMEVLTPGVKLQQQALLETYTPQCRFELGDARCGIHLDHLTVDGDVTAQVIPSAFNQAARRIFRDGSRMESDGYFDMGTVRWLTGDNSGAFSEVKSFTTGGTFVLWQTMIYPIAVGDQYEAVPGCNKLKETCINTFDNYTNFGGFPDVPGEDASKISPDTKSVSVSEVQG